MEKNTQEYTKFIVETAPIINAYYALVEASDIMIRLAEKLMNNKNIPLKHELKQRHTLVMNNIKLLKTNVENYEKDYKSFEKDWSQYDELRRTASYIARLILLISDRCYDNEGKEKLIEEFIETMPNKGIVKQEYINQLIFR